MDSEPAFMSESFRDTKPDLEDELCHIQSLPAPDRWSRRRVIISSTVASVRSPGTMDAFLTYAGLSGPDLPTSGWSLDAPGYL